MKEFARFVAYIICGLAIITVSCIIIFHIFPSPSSNTGYDAALAVAGVVMSWVLLGGFALFLSSLIKKLMRAKRH